MQLHVSCHLHEFQWQLHCLSQTLSYLPGSLCPLVRARRKQKLHTPEADLLKDKSTDIKEQDLVFSVAVSMPYRLLA